LFFGIFAILLKTKLSIVRFVQMHVESAHRDVPNESAQHVRSARGREKQGLVGIGSCWRIPERYDE